MAILAFDLGGSSVKYGVWTGKELTNQGSFPTPGSWEEMKAHLYSVYADKEMSRLVVLLLVHLE